MQLEASGSDLDSPTYLVQLEEMTSFRYGQAVTSKGALQWNALEIKTNTPLLLLQHTRILSPLSWKETSHGIAAQGLLYDLERQHTANIAVWKLGQQDQSILLTDP